mgnify:FL=1
MKKLKAVLCSAVIALWASVATSPSMAGSEDFAGLYISVQASMVGAELSGTHTDEDGADTDGSGGKVFPLAGGEVGYNIPVHENIFLTIGYAINPGEAVITEANDFMDAADHTVSVNNQETWFIRPSFSFSDNSAAFFKYGEVEANMRATSVTTPPSGLDGVTYAIGTTTLYNSGLFIQTEAGLTDFDELKFTGVGGSSSAKVEADPNIAYGTISVGYKF